jgi:hypothetical protein
MATTRITIEVHDDRLASYPDAYLAALWHAAQANPAPHGDPSAGRLAERIGREIIRRWPRATEPELYHHQGHSYYHRQLCRFARFQPGDGEPGSPTWHDGVWLPRAAGEDADQGEGAPS